MVCFSAQPMFVPLLYQVFVFCQLQIALAKFPALSHPLFLSLGGNNKTVTDYKTHLAVSVFFYAP